MNEYSPVSLARRVRPSDRHSKRSSAVDRGIHHIISLSGCLASPQPSGSRRSLSSTVHAAPRLASPASPRLRASSACDGDILHHARSNRCGRSTYRQCCRAQSSKTKLVLNLFLGWNARLQSALEADDPGFTLHYCRPICAQRNVSNLTSTIGRVNRLGDISAIRPRLFCCIPQAINLCKRIRSCSGCIFSWWSHPSSLCDALLASSLRYRAFCHRSNSGWHCKAGGSKMHRAPCVGAKLAEIALPPRHAATA